MASSQRTLLLLCFSAFVLTFFVTRTITRMIRAGKGPFKDNVSTSGMHIHHVVPGTITLILGVFIALGTRSSPWVEIAAVLIGVGTSLVMDEFALLLHMSDVYWSEQGRLSVELVSLTIACMGLMLAGLDPFRYSLGPGDAVAIVTVVILVVLQFSMIAICFAKGKVGIAVLGAFVPLIAFVAAVRLARPQSWWARRFYDPPRLARARLRAERSSRRSGRFTDVIGGFITSPAVVAADEQTGRAAPDHVDDARQPTGAPPAH